MLGPRVQSSGTQVPAVGNPPGFTRLPAVEPDHSTIHKGAPTEVVARSDARARTRSAGSVEAMGQASPPQTSSAGC